jgi:predicted PurR-regulated permease PerM
VLLLAGRLAVRAVAPFLAPPGWAAAFAMVLDPVQGRLARRVGRPQAAAATTVLAAISPRSR